MMDRHRSRGHLRPVWHPGDDTVLRGATDDCARLPRPLPDALVQLTARELQVLGQPLRIRIVDYLDQTGESSVQVLADALDAGQQNVSKHLGVLYGAGVVDRRREGREVW